jgi:hypothetical protein
MKEDFKKNLFSMNVLLYYKWNQGANEFGKKLMVRLVQIITKRATSNKVKVLTKDYNVHTQLSCIG